MLAFDLEEYQTRLQKTKKEMECLGIEVLLVSDPANMNYLTGYDAWSFYVDQMVVVIIDEPQPLWIGRYLDARGAKATTWIHDDYVISYPDHYVHALNKHPMDFVAEFLIQISQGDRNIGIEMESFYFSVRAFERLKTGLPNALIKDASLIVNKIRLIKSEHEINMMKKAALFTETAMTKGIQIMKDGTSECDVAAVIYYHLLKEREGMAGDYPAIVPLLPSGEQIGQPHQTWTERKLNHGDAAIIELSGCYKRYHVPMARTVSIGPPSKQLQWLSSVVSEGIQKVLDRVKPGVTCHELEETWRHSIQKYGLEKESRIGYSVGLNYPPDWGERTASLRKGDFTILEPNMTFHLIPALWFENHGMEISETFRVTEHGVETFTHLPKKLLLSEEWNQGDKIS
ncbi:M24 family metallopeptidase [Bacillaceae bacterium S4-13-58]